MTPGLSNGTDFNAVRLTWKLIIGLVPMYLYDGGRVISAFYSGSSVILWQMLLRGYYVCQAIRFLRLVMSSMLNSACNIETTYCSRRA